MNSLLKVSALWLLLAGCAAPPTAYHVPPEVTTGPDPKGETWEPRTTNVVELPLPNGAVEVQTFVMPVQRLAAVIAPPATNKVVELSWGAPGYAPTDTIFNVYWRSNADRGPWLLLGGVASNNCTVARTRTQMFFAVAASNNVTHLRSPLPGE